MRNQLLLTIMLSAGALTGSAQNQIPYIDSRAVIDSGIAHYDRGEYKEAIKEFSKVHECDTNYVTAMYEHVLAMVADSAYRDAIALAQAGLRLPDCNRRELTMLMANAYDYAGSTDTSMRIYDSLIARYPNDHQGYYEKGIVLFRRKEYDKAVASFQKGLLINPVHFRSHLMLGRVYAVQGRLSEALMALETSLMMTQVADQAKQAVATISLIVEGTDEVNKFYSERNEKYSDPVFDDIDQIINAKLALQPQYKLKVGINDNVFRQSQALMEKLKYVADDKNFAMQFYVPVLTEIYNSDLFEAYMLLMFSGYGYTNIDALAQRKRKEVDDVKKIVFPYYNHILNTRVLDSKQRQSANERYHLFAAENILAIGDMKMVGNEKSFVGDIVMYRTTDHTLAGSIHYTAEGEKDGTWKYYYSNGNPKSETTYKKGKVSGTMTEYYNNGNLKKVTRYNNNGEEEYVDEYEYAGWKSAATQRISDKVTENSSYLSNGQLEGKVRFSGKSIQDGEYVFYDAKGMKTKSVIFRDGRVNGHCIKYHDNGMVSETCTYEANELIGADTEFYDNGRVKNIYNYINGKADGPYIAYYDNGIVSAKGVFSRGKREEDRMYDRSGREYCVMTMNRNVPTSIRFTDDAGKVVYDKSSKQGLYEYPFYHPGGVKSADMHINEDGMRNGLMVFYYANGVKSEETNYKNGNREGSSRTYYLDGRPKSEATYDGDALDGYYKVFYNSGALMTEGWMKRGARQGVWRTYYVNGRIKNEAYYLNNKINGHFKDFNAGGELQYKCLYVNDMMVANVVYDSLGHVADSAAYPNGTTQYKSVAKNIPGRVELECPLKYGELNGSYITKYGNGSKAEEGMFHDGKRDSVITYYYPNGQLKCAGKIIKGEREGQWKFYLENGAVTTDEYYKAGSSQGQRKLYDGNMLRIAYNFRNDDRDSAQVYYGENGRIALAVYYDMGNITGYAHEGKDGKLLPMIPLKNGHADIRATYRDGTTSADLHIDRGMITGTLKIYFSNGQLQEERSYDGRDLTGIFRRYYPSGKLCHEVNYTHDEENGEERYLDENGNLQITHEYYSGTLHGNTMVYDSVTHKPRKYIYHYGELIYADK